MSRQLINIPGYYLYLLEEEFSKDLFIKGLIQIAEGEHPSSTYSGPVNDALGDIASGKLLPKTITNIPGYKNGTKFKLTPAWEQRYRKISKGFVPVFIGSGGSVKNLEFKNITTMKLDAVKSLAQECKIIIGSRKRDQYRHWVEYVFNTLKFIVESGQLKDF